MKEPLEYAVRGTIDVGGAKVVFARASAVRTPRLPTVRLAGVEAINSGIHGLTVNASLEVQNPNPFVLPVDGLKWKLTQLNEGAPADIFASANEKQMAVANENVEGGTALFASNTLTIAVPEGNPGGVTDFASLANPDLAVVVCAPEVPCGAATAKVEESLGVTLSPVSELTSVTDVLGSVASGEADAGLVYVTDLARAEGVEGIDFAGSEAAVTLYPIAVMTTGDAPDASRGFVDYVLGPRGLAALGAAGFGAPDADAGA
jgi:molybdate transport system substrate-binding protein